MLPKPNVESEGLMISKAKNPGRQRALVLVVRKGAVPAMLLCDALLCGVARQRTPYSSPALVDRSRGKTWGQQVTTHYVGKLFHTKSDTHTNQAKDVEEKHARVSLSPSLVVLSLPVNVQRFVVQASQRLST